MELLSPSQPRFQLYGNPVPCDRRWGADDGEEQEFVWGWEEEEGEEEEEEDFIQNRNREEGLILKHARRFLTRWDKRTVALREGWGTRHVTRRSHPEPEAQTLRARARAAHGPQPMIA